jgi:hypothetical protein
MVEVGMMEIALVGAGLVVGYVLGKMNGKGPIKKSDSSTKITDSYNTTGDDNRKSKQNH